MLRSHTLVRAPNSCPDDYTVSTKQYQVDNNSIHVYQNYSFVYTATTSFTAFTFACRNDGGSWYLDDVSMVVFGGGPELIENDGFEFEDLSFWDYCNPGDDEILGWDLTAEANVNSGTFAETSPNLKLLY
ncbi:unnamed protein product [Didymodactylos carnosus]|uniref:Uncharacterized protein n=1 Tax=Didymodactylos carnosus TaxID=1234261 RepID=A0A814JIA0_9BILA|nr:unnamed protein product [Didymodactylos carnosus]CAF3809081.1 unnamed protein product [Didymodactylos carnosus]